MLIYIYKKYAKHTITWICVLIKINKSHIFVKYKKLLFHCDHLIFISMNSLIQIFN